MVLGCKVLGDERINCKLSVLQRPLLSVEYQVDFVLLFLRYVLKVRKINRIYKPPSVCKKDGEELPL